MHFSFQKVFYAQASLFGLIALLILAKSILIPIAFAALISFILYPLARKIETWGFNRLFAAFLSMLIMFSIIGGTMFFFSTRLIELSTHFYEFQEKIMKLFSDVILFLNEKLITSHPIEKKDVISSANEWLNDSGKDMIGRTFNNTTTFIAQLVGMIIYTFLILIDRDGLTSAFIHFSPVSQQDRVKKMLRKVQQVGQKYLSGVLLIILILGIVNSIGLWIIGIDSPFFFGFLAASLSIIPYVGTTLGAVIPVLYAFMTYDSLFVPLSVAIMFWSVQLIESNFLSPKIVGGSVSINAFASILSLIIGGAIWGLAGMILFLPFTAMLKVVCEEYVELKPFALLIGIHESHEKRRKESFVHKGFMKLKSWITRSKVK